MEIIKRRISLEDSTDRSNNSKNWGKMTADTFYVNVFLTQNIDDMGLFTDLPYFSADTENPTPLDYTILTNKLALSGYTFPFMTNPTPYFNGYAVTPTEKDTLRLPLYQKSQYYSFFGVAISGLTDSKISDVKSYDINNPYKAGFDIDRETYVNYEGITIHGVNRVFSLGEPTIYVFDTPVDQYMGTDTQFYGLQYRDYTGQTRTVTSNGYTYQLLRTDFRFVGEGLNETNIGLSALTKEEYLFGIISVPEVKNDVFIDRGVTTVLERHLRLSEIKNLGDLSKYGNGFYNVVKQ